MTKDAVAILQEKVEKLEAICVMGQLISASLDIDTVVDRTMAAAERIVGAQGSSIWVLDPATEELHFHFARGGVGDKLKEIRIPVGEGIVGHAVAERQPILVENAAEDPRWQSRVDDVSGFHTRSILCLPLLVEGRPVGALQLLNKKDGGSFTMEDLHWMTFLSGQVAIALDNARFHANQIKLERIQRDLHIARAIHESIFPREMPSLPGYEVAGRTEACFEIGGDYYDLVPLRDGGALLVVADVAGKGISAALIAASFRAALRSGATVQPSISALASGLNLMRHLDGMHTRLRHVTAILSLLDVERHVLTVINAGHNPGLLVSPTGEVSRISATALPLGIRPELQAMPVEVPLHAGHTLLLYTDGVTECRHGEDELGMKRLERLLVDHRGRPAAWILAELWREMEAFAGGEGPADDRTAVILRRL